MSPQQTLCAIHVGRPILRHVSSGRDTLALQCGRKHGSSLLVPTSGPPELALRRDSTHGAAVL